MIKSPLRYPGGKSRAVKYIDTFIPDYNEFREPFFGGGSVSFHCIQQHDKHTYHASDLNYELYCFWSQLKVNSREVMDGIQRIYDNSKSDKRTYKNGKELFGEILERRNDNLSELQRAIDFFILNRITFSGVVDSGGYSQGSFEGRFTQSAIDRLSETVPVIRNIQFYCDNYSFLINRPGDDVLIFLDPPYYIATKSRLYGRNGILHTTFDHHALLESLRNCNHRWLITYDDSEYIRELYKDFYQVQWKLQYGMTNSSNSPSVLGNELLIANYDLYSVRERNLNKTTKKLTEA